VADGAFDLPFGFDECLLAALALGATGAVGSSFNLAAPVYQRLLKCFGAGDLPGARREQMRGVQLVHVLGRFGYMGAAKAVMRRLGVDVGPARLPNTNPSADETAALMKALEGLGFFDWIQR
jgi:N-acetylneuraminate lyase